MPTGEFTPRTVTLRDGARAVLRRVTLDDAPDVLATERAVVAAGEGVVRDLADMPEDARAMRKLLKPWVEGERSGDSACMLVAVAGEGEAPARADGVRVLGIGHLRRLKPAKVRHVAQTSLEVHPLAQRKGVGRAIMLGLLDWARGVGVNRVQLNVIADNHRAVALYESVGFERCGVRRRLVRDADGTEHDDLEMGLLLDEWGGVGRRCGV
jgi:RimJ/RimL family protein N-acetyltransferase